MLLHLPAVFSGSRLVVRTISGLLLLAWTGVGLIGCDRGTTPVSEPSPSPARPSIVGTGIEFNANAGSEAYRTSGWSKPEEQFTWSQGTSAKLELPVGSAPGSLILIAKIAAFINPPDVPTQPVQVYANGTQIDEWQVGNTADFKASIPAAAAEKGGMLVLEFQTAKAMSPKAAGAGDDDRLLGIALHRIELIRSP
ncbi:MAG TPA: hypothetical protein VK993_12805 [Chthoniobacterales bacterium]|nr:hypothetical protein [Chthoniobacterales bacterium]